MMFKVCTHYGKASIVCGFVESSGEHEALLKAEHMGLFTQHANWDRVSAVPASLTTHPLGSYRHQMQDAGRAHLLREED